MNASTQRSNSTSKCAALIASVLAAVLVACGGGVDSGGTGAPTITYASGPITGFGSVIVNGVHFDDAAASIRDGSGNTRSRDDLKLGMTTEINGSGVATDASGVSSSAASSIVFASALLGPVASVNPAAGTLTVLGQTVDIAPNTVFDDSLAGGLAGLIAGDVVEIYALPNFATLHYVATRIERRPGATAFVLLAALSNLNTQAKTFDLGGRLGVSYAALSAAQLPANLANGQVVRVQLATAPVANVWQASSLRAGGPQLARPRRSAGRGPDHEHRVEHAVQRRLDRHRRKPRVVPGRNRRARRRGQGPRGRHCCGAGHPGEPRRDPLRPAARAAGVRGRWRRERARHPPRKPSSCAGCSSTIRATWIFATARRTTFTLAAGSRCGAF